MITAHLTGNCGNHISQYAITRLIAERKGFQYGFDKPTHDYHEGMNQMYFMDINMGVPVHGITDYFEEKWTMYKGINISTFDKRVYNIEDNTCLIGHDGAYGGLYQSEDYYIDRKEDIIKWFAINPRYAEFYEQTLKDMNITLDDNTCVINFRGGEYMGIREVLLGRQYWKDAVNKMYKERPSMEFICITDDVVSARKFMPHDMPVIHVDIGFDFYVVNKAKWLIISNSSFGMWAAWLNTNVQKTIAPMYWSQYNFSNGYWGLGDQYYRCFTYLDRYGNLCNYDTCKSGAINFYRMNNLLPELYL